jgi:hypothetical protein
MRTGTGHHLRGRVSVGDRKRWAKEGRKPFEGQKQLGRKGASAPFRGIRLSIVVLIEHDLQASGERIKQCVTDFVRQNNAHQQRIARSLRIGVREYDGRCTVSTYCCGGHFRRNQVPYHDRGTEPSLDELTNVGQWFFRLSK